MAVACILQETEPHSAEYVRQIGKRGIDFGMSLLLVCLLSPIMAAIAIAVKMYDGGPVLYRRRVVGRRGTFDGYKFRTMRVDADAWLEAHPELNAVFQDRFKLEDDPRVTGLGRWLRKTSLDELPQLFNILRGEMALVGPRFICPPELERYGANARELRTVRPGLTGYWQVYGRQRVGYNERVQMDMDYIRNWRWALDLEILWLTPWAVLRGRGAH